MQSAVSLENELAREQANLAPSPAIESVDLYWKSKERKQRWGECRDCVCWEYYLALHVHDLQRVREKSGLTPGCSCFRHNSATTSEGPATTKASKTVDSCFCTTRKTGTHVRGNRLGYLRMMLAAKHHPVRHKPK